MPKALTGVSPAVLLSTKPKLLDEDFAKIEALLGVSLSSKDRGEIEKMRLFSDYYFSAYEQDEWQSESDALWRQHAQIKAEIDEFIADLKARLSRLGEVNNQTFRLYLHTWETKRREHAADPLRALTDLAADVEDTCFAIKPGKGRPPTKSDHPVTLYAGALLGLFTKLTGGLPSLEKSSKRIRFPDPFYVQAWEVTQALGLDCHISDKDELFDALHKAVKLRERELLAGGKAAAAELRSFGGSQK